MKKLLFLLTGGKALNNQVFFKFRID